MSFNFNSESTNASNDISSTRNTDVGDPNPEDVMKILIATDIHLGYGEKDQVIGKFINVL